MSFKSNIIASYASQSYVILISIAMLPLYIKYMGAEAYGLVGFFIMMQSWFNLLDIGLTPTIARETARFRGGAVDILTYRRVVRTVEGVFLAIALIGGAGLFISSAYIASNWLRASLLSVAEVRTALQIMAITVALRWLGGLYRGVISGSEQLVWLGGFNSLVATLRFVGVLLALMFIGATPAVFFGFQLVVAILELTGLLVFAYQLLPPIPKGKRIPWDRVALTRVLKFSLSIAFTSSVWVLVTQTDKLLLSNLLPLAEYGYFTLAVAVAGGVIVICGPISSAIMPRMAKLEATGDNDGLIQVYRQATQLAAITASAASLTMAFCAESLLFSWTGDIVFARQASPVLILYALGNGIMALGAFPYYLQYAKGDLRLHLIGNAGFLVFLIPSIVWAASKYGGVGAGYVWLTMNMIYFVTWVPLVHRRFAPGLNWRWFAQDVLAIYSMVALTGGYALLTVLPETRNRGWQAVEVVAMGLLLLLAGALASSTVWAKVNVWNCQRRLKRKGSI